MKKQKQSHDHWPEIRKRLEKEILINESFSFEPLAPDNVGEAFRFLDTMESSSLRFRLLAAQSAYEILFKFYPIIKLKVSEAVFESWLITHTLDDLLSIIGYSYET